MQWNSIIFDLDGVICHTDQYHYQAWKKLADRLGIYFDEKINNRLRGVSRMESLNIVLERSENTFTQEQKLQLAEEKNNTYRKLLENITQDDLTAEVRDTLEELRRRGYQLAIGSSSKNTGMILEHLGLKDFFDAVSDGTNITRSKPDPEVFIRAAEFLRAKPQDCLVVEDAAAGVDAAKAGGMTAAGIGEAADCQKTDYPLGRFADLLEICPLLSGCSDGAGRK